MHVVMAVGTKVLPVGTVRGVIVMVAVAVVDREEMGVGRIELPGAAGADEAVQAEGFLAVIGVVIKRGTHRAEFCLNFCCSRQFDTGRSARFHLNPFPASGCFFEKLMDKPVG